jgi:class 3 adenylate cyclase
MGRLHIRRRPRPPDPTTELAGIAVSIGARVSALAAPGQVLVSQTVKDLVAGSGIAFEDPGVQELKGVPGEWRMYAVTNP